MNGVQIPALDPTPLPGPVWLFHVLLVSTFVLHVLFMNVTLGGTILAAIGQTLSGGKEGDPRTILATRLMGVNVYAISLTITTGVAPLLFVQVLFQQYFYTATILMGWLWFAFLVLLAGGYYAAYAYKFRGAPARGSGGTAWLIASASMFLLIAMIHVAVAVLHVQPAIWADVQANPWLIFADRTYWPRLLHFLLAAIGFSALLIAWWSVRQAKKGIDVETNKEIASFCWKWALFTTALEIADGFVLLMVLPREVVFGLIGDGATMGPLMMVILFAMGLFAMLSRITDPMEQSGTLMGSLMTMTIIVGLMAITRHQVRLLYLEPFRGEEILATAPQWGNVTIFVALLVLGLLTVAYMVQHVLTNPATGEDAA